MIKGRVKMLNDFRGEVWINTHENILNAMIKANSEPVDGGYSVESYAAKATELMQKNFKDEIYTTFAMNGTAANIIALKAMLNRWDSVLCTEQTHIDNYEAGAFEYNLGNKILTIPSIVLIPRPPTKRVLSSSASYVAAPVRILKQAPGI